MKKLFLRNTVILGIVLLNIPLLARDPKVDEIDGPTEARPGKVALLTSGKGMKYFLRIPRGFQKDKGARMILFMHGSNMNGWQYLETIEEKRWCRDDILVCPNGEKGDATFGGNNYTFESAPYIKEIAESIRSAFKISRSYIGGHSQGGFVTYSVIMHYPDLFDGAFPMAGDCWMQNEPNLWETKPEMMAKQKEIAIAVIHGRADPIVNFSQGEHAYGVFLAMGYPKLRFFAPEKLGHQFGLSPVPEALEWLDAMTAHDPGEAMKMARDWFRVGEWGWVNQSARAVIANRESDSRTLATAKNAIAAVEKEALEAAAKMRESITSKPAREWLPEWFEFRRQFGASDAAKDLVEKYQSAREKERQEGAALFRKASGQRRAGDKSAMKETLDELLEKAPHSFHAWYALEWTKED